MGTERRAALDALLEYREKGSWPDLYLKNKLKGLEPAQAALASNITYGVVQNTRLIDYYIAHYSSIKLNKISPFVLESMRMAVYQILFLDRVPDSAAVNEAVKLINKTGNKRASGFANGILRTISREKNNLPEVKGKDRAEILSIKYSHPLWMTRRFISLFGTENAEELLKADNSPAPAVVRVNTLKSTSSRFAELCDKLGVGTEPVADIENAYIVSETGPLIKSREFEEGMFYIQDTASQLAVSVLAPKAGDRVLDICAAPGGKSLLAAQLMDNKGKIVSNDIYPHKVRLIEENAARYGAPIIHTSCQDARLYSTEDTGLFDKIICDVPCSGLGIIRKKPDVRNKDEKSLTDLPEIQSAILESASKCLKPGGRMIYTTCTILPEENEEVLKAFLDKHGEEYSLCPFTLRGKDYDGSVTLLPHKDGTDGFFISLIERRDSR